MIGPRACGASATAATTAAGIASDRTIPITNRRRLVGLILAQEPASVRQYHFHARRILGSLTPDRDRINASHRLPPITSSASTSPASPCEPSAALDPRPAPDDHGCVSKRIATIAGVVTLLAAATFVASAESSVSPRRAAQRRAEQHVDSEAKRFDGRFLCLRFPPTGPYVVIVITSAAKRSTAEGIIKRIDLSPSAVEVRDPAQYQREGVALKKKIAAEKPARYKRLEVWWPGVYNGGGFECAQVRLSVSSRHVSASALEWANETVRRYGNQRVEIEYIRTVTPE
jgi:hypothetical protein